VSAEPSPSEAALTEITALCRDHLSQEGSCCPHLAEAVLEIARRGGGERRVVMAPGIPDLVAVGNGPLLDPSCRNGQHVLCLGAPCECPVPGVHTARHDHERSQP